MCIKAKQLLSIYANLAMKVDEMRIPRECERRHLVRVVVVVADVIDCPVPKCRSVNWPAIQS